MRQNGANTLNQRPPLPLRAYAHEQFVGCCVARDTSSGGRDNRFFGHEALELADDSISSCLDTETGEVHSITEEEFDLAGDPQTILEETIASSFTSTVISSQV